MKLSWAAPLGLASAGTVGFVLLIGYLYFNKERRNLHETTPKEIDEQASHRSSERNYPCPDYKYDGVALYAEEDRQEVIDLISHLRKYSNVQNLSLDGYDALPVAGKTQFNCMDYVLNHSYFIFIYISPNFTQDKMLQFQAQMCLMDVIMKEEWRVIPVWADKNYKSYCPSELKLLHGLEKWNISSANRSINNYVNYIFDRLISDGRARLQGLYM